jgi:hypothetical protein
LGLIAKGAIAINAATAPSANGPAFEAPATSPPERYSRPKPPEGGVSFSLLKGTWNQFNRPLVTKRTLSRSEPMSLVNIELYRAVVAHLQQERLAVVLILDVNALHDVESFQGLFAKSN